MNKHGVFCACMGAGIIISIGLLLVGLILIGVSSSHSKYAPTCTLVEKFEQKKLVAYRCTDGVVYWETY